MLAATVTPASVVAAMRRSAKRQCAAEHVKGRLARAALYLSEIGQAQVLMHFGIKPRGIFA
eukprot:gene13489-biopygen40